MNSPAHTKTKQRDMNSILQQHYARQQAIRRSSGAPDASHTSSSRSSMTEDDAPGYAQRASGSDQHRDDGSRRHSRTLSGSSRFAPYPTPTTTTIAASSTNVSVYDDPRRSRKPRLPRAPSDRPQRTVDLSGLFQQSAPQANLQSGGARQDHKIEGWTRPNWLGSVKPPLNEKDISHGLRELRKLRTIIGKCQVDGEHHDEDAKRLNQLREILHEVESIKVAAIDVQRSGVLDVPQPHCLAQLFAGTRSYPHDIRADAKGLALRWGNEDFDPDIMRGIKRSGKGYAVDTTYSGYHMHPYTFGDEHLVNGQWWPLRVCMLRDRAHGMSQAGIHGEPGKGAFSIVVAEGGYQDIDDGHTIYYCGTQASEERNGDTASTQLLIDSERSRDRNGKRRPVRVFRTQNMPETSQYRPARGIRYDGLYEVLSWEQLGDGMKRFKLHRLEDQDPIRSGGLAQRPTEQEIRRFDQITGRR